MIRICSGAVGTLLLLSLTACASEQKREYAAPAQLCGTPMRAKLFEDLLPDGKRISVQPVETKAIGFTHCRINVDGRDILSAITEWRRRGADIAEIASPPFGKGFDNHVAADGSYSYAERGGVSRVNCPNPPRSWQRTNGQLFVMMYTHPPAPPNESAMKNLVTGYAKAVGTSSECN